MRVWIDFINTPQVSFFEGIVPKLKEKGHEVVFTCRDSSNTLDLIKLKGWDHTVIDGYTGKSTLLKFLLFPKRLISLYKHIRKEKIDVAVCQSSFYLPVIARLLKIRSIYTNDNEHAQGNWLGLVFATNVFFPEVLKEYFDGIPSVFKKKVSYYPGIKEGIYLRKLNYEVNIAKKEKTIFYRPEPLTAQYYKGPLYSLDKLLISLSEKFEVVIMPRGGEQLLHYKNDKFTKCTVLGKPITFEEVCRRCDLFIGGGGSMTRELAVVGKKVISNYGGDLLASDVYLIKNGLMHHTNKIDIELINKYFEDNDVFKESYKSKEILNLGMRAEVQLINQICKIN